LIHWQAAVGRLIFDEFAEVEGSDVGEESDKSGGTGAVTTGRLSPALRFHHKNQDREEAAHGVPENRGEKGIVMGGGLALISAFSLPDSVAMVVFIATWGCPGSVSN